MAPELMPRFTDLNDLVNYLTKELAMQPDGKLQIFCETGTIKTFLISFITTQQDIQNAAPDILDVQTKGLGTLYIL